MRQEGSRGRTLEDVRQRDSPAVGGWGWRGRVYEWRRRTGQCLTSMRHDGEARTMVGGGSDNCRVPLLGEDGDVGQQIQAGSGSD